MRNIRKIVAILMIMVMTSLVLAGCGNSSESAAKDISGTWTCTALDMGSGDVLDQLGSSYADSIMFYALEDGTCLLDMAGQQMPMHWNWMEENSDYKLTITIADFAEANNMTEEEMTAALQGSGSSDVDTEQNYKAEVKDGTLVLDMAAFYDDVHAKDDSSVDSSYKMEFKFSKKGEAPSSLDDVKNY